MELEGTRWNDEARARLERIPIAFIRGKVEKGLEAFAQRQGIDVITAEVMQEALAGDGRSRMLGRKPLFRKRVSFEQVSNEEDPD